MSEMPTYDNMVLLRTEASRVLTPNGLEVLAQMERFVLEHVDAARRFASLTSPETIEKAAKALAAEMLRPVVDPERDVRSRRYAEAVLRSVEEGKT